MQCGADGMSKAFSTFLAFAVEEYAKTHVVLTSPILIKQFGEVVEKKEDGMWYHHGDVKL